jgi:triacylglycerol esterase/lipase EstA (alpha/beta hydrolase family)
MLARAQQWVVVVWMGGALGWLAWSLAQGRPTSGLIGAIAFLGVHAWVLGLEFLLLPWINRGDPAPAASSRQVLRAWWGEVRASTLVFGWRQPWRSSSEPDHLPASGTGRRGVVLVHGFMCNRGFWNPWLVRLRAAGVPFVAVNLEPVLGSIERYADIVDAAVRRVSDATGLAPLIVAHSMGGLATRFWVSERGAEGRVHGVVTIGTPHRGTWMAQFGLTHNAREMRQDSQWVGRLAARENASRRALFMCFYSHCDNIACPASTGTLPGADNRHVPGAAHIELAFHETVFASVFERLETAQPSTS